MVADFNNIFMNREIKFRMWDSHFNKMVGPDSVCHLDGEASNGMADGNVLMQFTGHTLKNGKDIYEGDVVVVKGMKSVGEYRTIVIYKNFGFVLSENKTYYKSNVCLLAIIEVIGNIYQNHELLEHKRP